MTQQELKKYIHKATYDNGSISIEVNFKAVRKRWHWWAMDIDALGDGEALARHERQEIGNELAEFITAAINEKLARTF